MEAIVPAQLSIASILAVYGSASALVVAVLWICSRNYKYLTKTDRLLMCWFAFSGLTHIILEGYFVFTPSLFRRQDVHFLAEVWKEYNNGDSRYGSRDPTVVIVEGITAVLAGPGCLLAVYAIAKMKAYRYTVQLAVSVGQIYGDIVYFGQAYLDEREFTKPGFLYFWFYYIFMNGIWVVVPLLIVIRAWIKINQGFEGTRKEVKNKASLDRKRMMCFYFLKLYEHLLYWTGRISNVFKGPREQAVQQDFEEIISMVLRRPIEEALEEEDGSPSFLEKTLEFIERYGVKAEGILRLSGPFGGVGHRIYAYELGNTTFSEEEDPHLVSDCMQRALKELESPVVPSPCCDALLHAYITQVNRQAQIDAMRDAVNTLLPYPNRRLLQRILRMGRNVEAYKKNRMTARAIAVCMCPIVLKPLMGDYDRADETDRATKDALNAAFILEILLEEYETIFQDGAVDDLEAQLVIH